MLRVVSEVIGTTNVYGTTAVGVNVSCVMRHLSEIISLVCHETRNFLFRKIFGPIQNLHFTTLQIFHNLKPS
jgi:hypothetical protein